VIVLVVLAWLTVVSVFAAVFLRAKAVLFHRRIQTPVFASDPDLRQYYGKLGLACELGFYLSGLFSFALLSWFCVELFGVVVALIIMGIVVVTGVLLWGLSKL